MESRAKFLGHPVHPMLVTFPLGLLIVSLIFDIIRLAGGGPTFSIVAFYMISSGLIGGVAAALFGWIDWFAIPSGTRASRIGLFHGLGNATLLVLFFVSWLLRRPDIATTHIAPFVLSCVGIALGTVTAWLGGELVDRLGVGVDPGANLNAPSSLTDLPAGQGHGPEEHGQRAA